MFRLAVGFVSYAADGCAVGRGSPDPVRRPTAGLPAFGFVDRTKCDRSRALRQPWRARRRCYAKHSKTHRGPACAEPEPESTQQLPTFRWVRFVRGVFTAIAPPWRPRAPVPGSSRVALVACPPVRSFEGARQTLAGQPFVLRKALKNRSWSIMAQART
jgi:hypothetical protein